MADTDLPARGGHTSGLPLSVVVTGGAGQVAGPAAWCGRRGWSLGGLRVTLRDPADLRGNARRVVAAVDAARDEGALADEVVVQVALPASAPTPDWAAAVDEVAARELVVALPIAGADPVLVRSWLEVVLDRETPVVALGGDPVAVLGAVRRCLDRTPAAGPGDDPLDGLEAAGLVRARRWLLAVATDEAGTTGLAETLVARGLRS